MYKLIGKRILLGITGGVAAYKAAVLLRLLLQQGADVRVVMTQNATQFITPLTFQALSGKRVQVDLFDPETDSAMPHIELARWSDRILIAPASANFIAKYAIGLAEDLLTTLCLATDVPVIVAPAMNQKMWSHPTTQENITRLKKLNTILISTAEGEQACGEYGQGRMAEPNDIVAMVSKSFAKDSLHGTRLLVTAGPTQEAIDPVRYISNRSSGLMGYAIAKAAYEAGADVSIISGPVKLPALEQAKITHVVSANEMYHEVMTNVCNHDIFISAAAVSDYRLPAIKQSKIKKSEDMLELVLVRNRDILADVSALNNRPFTVGFAAETENLEVNARKKLVAKDLDLIIANQVGEGRGFETEENECTVFWKDGKKQFPQVSKEKLARHLIALVADHYNEKNKNKIH